MAQQDATARLPSAPQELDQLLQQRVDGQLKVSSLSHENSRWYGFLCTAASNISLHCMMFGLLIALFCAVPGWSDASVSDSLEQSSQSRRRTRATHLHC